MGMKEIPSLIGCVGIFFFADGNLLLHTCPFSDALPYGDFLNYPLSHDDVWIKRYQAQYKVDFDYWPRGRIIYNTKENAYTVFYAGDAQGLYAFQCQPCVHSCRSCSASTI